MRKITEAKISGKNILLRIDTDVKLQDDNIIDDERLKASIPTIKYLLDNDAKVTIIGHIGRPARIATQSVAGGPKGREVEELKMRPVEDKLIELLGTHTNWQILENLRFSAGEENNDPEFTKQLVAGQDIFVQDAFATCHRAHASTVGVAKLLSSYAGFSVQNEVENLSKILASPKENFTIIIGGKKAEDKLPVIENLFDKAENFLIGGVVANTFLACQNYKLGKSLVENEVLEQAKEILQKFAGNPLKKILLPVDLLFSKSIERPEDARQESIDDLKNLEEYFVVDIGVETIANFLVTIKNSKTIFWNGNMGISEIKEFSEGTFKIAEAISNTQARKYAGGGDTSSFIRKIGLQDNFNFISSAGGATLEYLAGKRLPGLEVLR